MGGPYTRPPSWGLFLGAHPFGRLSEESESDAFIVSTSDRPPDLLAEEEFHSALPRENFEVITYPTPSSLLNFVERNGEVGGTPLGTPSLILL
jgi:hypothetical protein